MAERSMAAKPKAMLARAILLIVVENDPPPSEEIRFDMKKGRFKLL